MANSSPVSMKVGKAPKAPKMSASKSSWDKYEKSKKAYDDKVKKVAAEKARRQKIKSK